MNKTYLILLPLVMLSIAVSAKETMLFDSGMNLIENMPFTFSIYNIKVEPANCLDVIHVYNFTSEQYDAQVWLPELQMWYPVIGGTNFSIVSEGSYVYFETNSKCEVTFKSNTQKHMFKKLKMNHHHPIKIKHRR